MKLYRLIPILLMLICQVVFGQDMVNFAGEGFNLCGYGKKEVSVYVPKEAPIGVRLAAENLCRDIEQVSGIKAALVNKSKNADIRIKLAKDDSAWETYSIKVDRSGIDITGSDRRGTIYGIYEISKAIGVSPWYWWADVPTEKHPELYFSYGEYTTPSPSVKYRGIFINDEDWCLYPWSKNNFEKELGDIGPKTYKKVCELILRLKGNMLAPAMHTCTAAFYSIPQNKLVADSLGVIITTSHCEPLLLNNAYPTEWDSGRDGEWNYATNKETIYGKWSDRLDQASMFDNIYTMAMRGVHDQGLQGNFTPEQRVDLLSKVIDDQRELLVEKTGKNIEDIPQIFVPYKETMDIYEDGLQVPDDITIVWVDDNYGYMKRLSSAEEQKRSGGSGVYYHISYLGSPHEYLWLQTTPPVLMYEELMKAYNTGADRYWLLNVGDIKPGELGMSTFFDLAWNVEAFDINSVNFHQARLLSDIFGAEYRQELQSILDEYYRLAWEHKPEYMGGEHEWDGRDYEQLRDTHHSFDNGQVQLRLSQYRSIADKANALWNRMPPKYKPAFFQLVAYPVLGAYQMNRKFLMAKLNHELYRKGQAAQANRAAQQSICANDSIEALNNIYNTMVDGKWNGFGTVTPGIMARYQNMPQLNITENIEPKAVDLTPIMITNPKSIALKVDLRDYSAKTDDVNLVKGLGYDWIVVQMGKPVAEIGDSETVDPQTSGYITYTLPAIDSDNIDITVSTVPFFPIYKGQDTRIGVSVDGGQVKEIANHFKEYSRQWKNQILVNGASHVLSFDIDPTLPSHTLTFHTLDPGQMIQSVRVDHGLYRNPVINTSVPDPTVIKGEDGMFYLYGTENIRNVPVFRSDDLVNWQQIGTAFTDQTRPRMVPEGNIWAPDINKIGDKYVLYFSKYRWGGEWECGIGRAVSDNPEGPFTDAQKLFLSNEIDVQNSIDPFFIEDTDGSKYLFWGSFGGIYAIELTDDGLAVKPGAQKQRIAGTMIEGTYIIKRGPYYYLLGSAGSCCDGGYSSYHVMVARSENLFGPYVNRQGKPALENGFDMVLQGNDFVIGPGHNAELVQDDNGQYWILFHGFDSSEIEKGRKVYLEPVQWDDEGWPYVETITRENTKPYFKK